MSNFTRELELENAALRHSEENLASTVRGLEFELEKAQKKVVALRAKVEQLERAILRYAHIEESLASTVRGLEFELEKANVALDLLNTHCMSAEPIMGRSTYRWTIEHDEPDIRAAISKAVA